jgi:hypothetical protein
MRDRTADGVPRREVREARGRCPHQAARIATFVSRASTQPCSRWLPSAERASDLARLHTRHHLGLDRPSQTQAAHSTSVHSGTVDANNPEPARALTVPLFA